MVKFTYNLKQLSDGVRRELQQYQNRIKKGMDSVGNFVAGEAKDLAPVDKGFLTSDIANSTEKYKSSYAAVIYIPANATSAQYAIAMHENQYKLGKNSQAKQAKVGKPVGRKFITRAIDGNMEKIRKILQSELKA